MKYFGYSKWEDVGLEYNNMEYVWHVIQTRTRNRDNKRQFRSVVVQRYGVLTDETISKIEEIIKTKQNEKRD